MVAHGSDDLSVASPFNSMPLSAPRILDGRAYEVVAPASDWWGRDSSIAPRERVSMMPRLPVGAPVCEWLNSGMRYVGFMRRSPDVPRIVEF